MARQLSTEELDLITEWREIGVLQDVDGHCLDAGNGVILVTCADGDRFADIFFHQHKILKDCGAGCRIHTLSWHGGALACAYSSPVNTEKGADRVFRAQIPVARTLQDINTVVFLEHAPCGAVDLAHLDLAESVNLHFQAKKHIKKENEGMVVVPYFHVDYGKEKKRSYFLSREHHEEWMGKAKKN
jgi:hypothetical protein